jgi:photosystem II stability/assembly factor-like uncharacterized protein
MEQPPDLESLYAEAQAAIAAKDFERATDLLKRILIQDENYKDSSRLLAKLVERQQYRWHRSLWLRGSIVAVAIVAPVVILVGKLSSQPSAPIQPPQTPTSTSIPIPASQIPTAIPERASATPSAMPTSIRFVWERLWIGQELVRARIAAIALDPTDSDILYVGTENAGIYKSIDGGISWQPMHNGLGRASVLSLVIDPVDPRTVYAGVSTEGVYKTTDGGANWLASNRGIDRYGWDEVASLAIDPQDNQHLFFTAHNGLFETGDGGENWVKIHDVYPSQCFANVQFDPLGRGIVYAISDSGGSCQGGIFKSEDDGRSWGAIGFEGLGIDQYHQLQTLAIDQQDGSLYLSTIQGIYVSKDDGDTWQSIAESKCQSLNLAMDDGNVIYCTSMGEVAKTIDGGNTWVSFETPSASHGWTAIVFVPRNPEMVMLGGEGVIFSNNGGEAWEERSSGLGVGLMDLTLDPSDEAILYLEQRTNGRVYRSMDGGQSWELFDDKGYDIALDSTGDFLYRISRATGEEGLNKSIDRGQSWEQVPWPMVGNIMAIAAHPKQSQWLYITYGGEYPPYLFFSQDGGRGWEAALGMEQIWYGRFYFDHDDGNVIYVVSYIDAFRSEDSGETWERCGSASIWYSQSYSRLAVDPRDSNHLILATRGEGVSVSEDGCQSWRSSNDGLDSLFINTIAYDPNNPDTLYAGTDGGAYVSFDGGETWAEINQGLLGATVVYSIVVDPQSRVYAATPYGIFRLEAK